MSSTTYHPTFASLSVRAKISEQSSEGIWAIAYVRLLDPLLVAVYTHIDEPLPLTDIRHFIGTPVSRINQECKDAVTFISNMKNRLTVV